MNDKIIGTSLIALHVVGAVFSGLFLAAYLGGLFVIPQTTVFHSVPIIKQTLKVLGITTLATILVTVILAIFKRKHDN